MRKILLIFKALFLLLTAPFEISKGRRKRAITEAKKLYSSVNLF